MADVYEQIRRDAVEASLQCPEPTAEQMRQVGAVLRPALDRLRESRERGAA